MPVTKHRFIGWKMRWTQAQLRKIFSSEKLEMHGRRTLEKDTHGGNVFYSPLALVWKCCNHTAAAVT